MVFVNSMSDLFHEDVPDEYIREVVEVMLQANWHTYQVLTKRSGRMRELLQTRLNDAAAAPQIWWGVSVENQRDGLPRIRRPASKHRPPLAFFPSSRFWKTSGRSI